VRSTWDIVLRPQFMLSCTIATLAHTIMVMLMSNVTVAMSDDNYSFTICSIVMELHFFAMFAPGFVSGKLIEHYGSFRVAMIGAFVFAGSSVVFAIGTELWNYFLGMILLGIAWNFAFSAGTVMLTGCYRVSACIVD
jgi:MFS family permease